MFIACVELRMSVCSQLTSRLIWWQVKILLNLQGRTWVEIHPDSHLTYICLIWRLLCLVTRSTQDRKRASSASIIYAYIDLSAARNSKVSGLSKTKSVESARLNRHI